MRHLLIFGILLLAWSTVCWAQASTTGPSRTIDSFIGATDEPAIGWKPWFCPDGEEWRVSESGEFGHCCPVGQENCFQGVECVSTSLIVEANGQRTHTCSGPSELPVCVTGTVLEQVGETGSVVNVACWPSWTVNWDATRTTTPVSVLTKVPLPTPGPPTPEPTPGGEEDGNKVEEEQDQGLSTGEKIGIGFGVPVFLLLCGVVFWLLRRHRRHQPPPTSAPVGPGSVMTYTASYQDGSDSTHEPGTTGQFLFAPFAVLGGHKDRKRHKTTATTTTMTGGSGGRSSDSASGHSRVRDGSLAPEVTTASNDAVAAPPRTAHVQPTTAQPTAGRLVRVAFPPADEDNASGPGPGPPPVPLSTRPAFPQEPPAAAFPGEASPQEQARRFSEVQGAASSYNGSGGAPSSFAPTVDHLGSPVRDAVELSAIRPPREMSGESATNPRA